MKIASLFFWLIASQEHRKKKAVCLMILLVNLISGCAALNNSASFYQDQPRRPINWREYTSD